VIVNLDEQTVFFLGYVAPIDDVEEAPASTSREG
jgi:hypothetical protein